MEKMDSVLSALEDKAAKLDLELAMKKNIKLKLENDLATKNKELDRLSGYIDVLEQVRILLQKASEYAREQIRQQIEMLVTHCLQFVFGSNIEFCIELNEVRGKAEAEFYVLSTYDTIKIKTRPEDARGGGVVDIISLALRIAVIQSTNLYKDGPLILDEPAKHVSGEYIANVAQFLKQICDVFNRQIIMVTHNQYLSEIADLSYLVELRDGYSDVSIFESTL
jgi:DNA repair exonuclease SbcCD ATPase subunit